jgi:prepilin-type N-terminal cleavage/methylation domain-containing protein
MKNQKGVTLIELLVAVALLGIVVIPIITMMTGSYTNTVIQGRESKSLYYAQEIIEEARITSFPNGLAGVSLYGKCTNSGCSEINYTNISVPILTDAETMYRIEFSNLDNANPTTILDDFYEIKVFVEVNEPINQEVVLVSVVKRQ